MIHIIHHNDLDGYMSGTILKIYNPTAKCYSVDYDHIENFPSKEVFNQGDTVFLLDFTASDEMMNYFMNNTDFYWIDHHKSSISSSKEKGFDKIKGFRKEGLCGAELSWIFCNKDKEIPDFVKLVGDFDTFRKSEEDYHYNVVLPFFIGVQLEFDNLIPENFDSKNFLFKKIEDFEDINVKKIINTGKIIYDYKIKVNKVELFDKCFEIEFHGYKTLCVNSCDINSYELIASGIYDEKKHDLMIIYYFNGEKYCYGIYTQKKNIDVSKIAKKYNGGGHPGASGFTTSEIIKELK